MYYVGLTLNMPKLKLMWCVLVRSYC